MSTVGDTPSFSKGGASPFAGLTVPYRIDRVLLRGTTVWVDGMPSEAAPGLILYPHA
jgi:dihydroorotase